VSTRIAERVFPCVYAAMQMSRSVRKPIGRNCLSTTGTAPQRSSHMICAALFNESSGAQNLVARFIICSTIIDFSCDMNLLGSVLGPALP
jgi:hypothetical protein